MSNSTHNAAVPRHVAIIMDGNGRWAKQHKLGRVRGHREGIKATREVVSRAHLFGVRYLTLFTFSTENWGRPVKEVNALMELLASNLTKETPGLKERGIRVRVIGDRSRLPANALAAIEQSERDTAACETMDLMLAISYGGREEIIHAFKCLMRQGVDPETIDEGLIRSCLYAPDAPDPDLLIRTSGEMRISNFLLWQLAYSEIYVTDVLWPDFKGDEFDVALDNYAKRTRRFGLTDEQAVGKGGAAAGGAQ